MVESDGFAGDGRDGDQEGEDCKGETGVTEVVGASKEFGFCFDGGDGWG